MANSITAPTQRRGGGGLAAATGTNNEYTHANANGNAHAAPPPHPLLQLPLGRVRWRTLVDNFAVELFASLLINLVTILCWPAPDADGLLQLVPPLSLGFVLLCIKDEDYFFPDGSPYVTLVLWVLGGYTWTHVAARLAGQCMAFALSGWICLYAVVPSLQHRVEHAPTVVFAMELIATTLEHLAVVYVILPLLPPAQHGRATSTAESLALVFPKVKPKAHHEAQAPSNHAVMHAAVTFSGLHWCLWRGLCADVNPAVTLLIAILRSLPTSSSSSSHDETPAPTTHGSHHEPWATAILALWGQAVGLCVCVAYVALYAPRETKYWPGLVQTHRAVAHPHPPLPPPPPPPPTMAAPSALTMRSQSPQSAQPPPPPSSFHFNAHHHLRQPPLQQGASSSAYFQRMPQQQPPPLLY